MNIFRITPNRGGSYLAYPLADVTFCIFAMVTPIGMSNGVFIDLRNIQL